MSYSIQFPGNCGCNNNQSIYGTNMWNVNGNQPSNSTSCNHQQACNGCIDIVKGLCVLYTGTNLTSLGINQNDDLNTIFSKLNALKVIQDTKNTNILAALNDVNTRLNALESGADHIPYTLL